MSIVAQLRKFISKIPFIVALHRFYNYLPILTYDAKRFFCYSIMRPKDKFSANYRILMELHVLEKGLTMPQTRPDFGDAIIKSLCSNIKLYLKNYKTPSFEVKYATSVLKEYLDFHTQRALKLSEWKIKEINELLEVVPIIEEAKQIEISKKDFFAYKNSPFDEFSKHRFTCRDFDGEVPLSTILDAIELAKKAPSACNRQPCLVHIVETKSLIEECLALQNGNRGFGQNADKLIIITGDIRSLGMMERFDIFVNGGILVMNICYALHFYEVGNCILNWSVKPENDKKMRKLLGIPNHEQIISIILCGNPRNDLRIACSMRKPTSDIIKIHSKK